MTKMIKKNLNPYFFSVLNNNIAVYLDKKLFPVYLWQKLKP